MFCCVKVIASVEPMLADLNLILVSADVGSDAESSSGFRLPWAIPHCLASTALRPRTAHESRLTPQSFSLLGHHQIPTDQRHDAQDLSGEEAFKTFSLQLQVLVDVPEICAKATEICCVESILKDHHINSV